MKWACVFVTESSVLGYLYADQRYVTVPELLQLNAWAKETVQQWQAGRQAGRKACAMPSMPSQPVSTWFNLCYTHLELVSMLNHLINVQMPPLLQHAVTFSCAGCRNAMKYQNLHVLLPIAHAFYLAHPYAVPIPPVK